MKKLSVRLLALALCLLMFVQLVPVPTMAAEAAKPMTVKADTTVALPGDTIQVNIRIADNPGISSLRVGISYDEKLTLKNVVFNGAFGPHATTPQPYTNPQQLTLISPMSDVKTNGVFATLTFEVSEDTPDSHVADIILTYQETDIYNAKFELVDTTVVNGKVTVYDGIPGDINADKRVTSKDAVALFRYVAGWKENVDEEAPDVNGDGIIDTRDAVILFRYVAGWPGIVLVRGKVCDHDAMEAVPAKAATCTESGNIPYWHCPACNRYYSSAAANTLITLADTVINAKGHTLVTVPGYAPNYEKPGLSDGIKCSVDGCDYVKQAQVEIPPLQPDECYVDYNLAGTDEYLKQYLTTVDPAAINPNPSTINTTSADYNLAAIDINAIPGYEFQGWVDGYGEPVRTIAKGTTGSITLIAQWAKTVYTVTFDSPLIPKEKVTRTIDEVIYLPQNLEWDHYVFMGWSDASGKIIDVIKPGTKDITVHANWTSNRNQAKANDYLKDGPIIIEDDAAKKYYFVYNLGMILNVPLETVLDLGYRSSLGIEETVIKRVVLENTEATTLNKAVEDATTNSSSWTLANDWNELLTDITGGETEVAKNQTIALSTGSSHAYNSSGSTYVGESFHASNDTLTTSKTVTDDSYKLGMDASIGAGWGPIKAEIGVSAETAHSTNQEDYSENKTSMSLDSAWNSSSSFSSSSSFTSQSNVSNSIMEKARDNWQHEISKSIGGSDSQTTSGTVSNTVTEGYTSLMQFHSVEEDVTIQKISSGADTTPGYYRYVLAGDFYVYAIVCYDVVSGAYSVTTQSVLADKTRTFLDYSKNDPLYGDYNNAVLPFEVPIDVHNYIFDSLAMTKGLIIDKDTGVVTDYEGTAKNVFIPDYAVFKNEDGSTPDIVKITAFEADVFAGKDVEMVKLGAYITAIPENAFENCTALKSVQYNTITSIGKEAFKGCTALESFTVANTVKTLGANAFDGVGDLVVNAANASVAMNAVSSTAGSMTLNLNALTNSLANVELDVKATESFTINGYGTTYSGVNIKSAAATTVINRMVFVNNVKVPLQLSSADVTLNQVKIENAPAFGLILEAPTTVVTLQGKVSVTTTGSSAILCRNINVVRKNGVIDATELNVYDKYIQVCGVVSNAKGYLKMADVSQIKTISEKEFEMMLTSKTVYFHANGGTTPEDSRICNNYEPIGTLPTPVRDYYTFLGWYTDMVAGTKVTAGSMLPAGENVTLYARWELNPVKMALASSVPAGALKVDEKWTYTRTQTTESTSSTMSGWVATGNYWRQTGTGTHYYASFPSGYSTSDSFYKKYAHAALSASLTENKKREVSAGTHYTYIYWHWTYAQTSYDYRTWDRLIADKYNTWISGNGYATHWSAFESTTNYPNQNGWYKAQTTDVWAASSYWWFRVNVQKQTYTDYEKVYQYKKVTEGVESETEISAGGEISNVQHYVYYREK